jgi:hypothetical protein
MPIKGLDELLNDLDRRARPGPPSKNRALAKFAAINDTWGSTDGTITITVGTTNAYQWGTASSTAVQLVWSAGEWS